MPDSVQTTCFAPAVVCHQMACGVSHILLVVSVERVMAGACATLRLAVTGCHLCGVHCNFHSNVPSLTGMGCHTLVAGQDDGTFDHQLAAYNITSCRLAESCTNRLLVSDIMDTRWPSAT
jgi:hypothetical protein